MVEHHSRPHASLLEGLSHKEAKEKLREFGFNEIRELSSVSPFKILFRQVRKNFIVYLLSFAMIISFFVGKPITGYAILAVLFIVISVSFIQEYRAEKAIKALKSMIMPIYIVVREGKEHEVPSKEIVPDDVVVLRTGERIPADCVVLEEQELRVNEAVLTGEAKEIEKKRHNALFMGTFVVSGKTKAKVLHTGMNTEFGKIAGMISTAEKELPLQIKVNTIAKYMAFVAVSVSLLTGFIMLVRSQPFSYELLVDVLIVVIALSVSAFPEGFPIVLISTLASGAYRMAKNNAIVNRMSIIETLGETTVVCADKTGTITKGEMTVRKILIDGKIIEVTGVGYDADGHFLQNGKSINAHEKKSLHLFLKASALCNDSTIERKGTDKEYTPNGSSTETALLIVAAKADIFKEDIAFNIKEEIPFSSERKFMSVLSEEESDLFVYAKGAPEVLLEKCTSILQTNGQIVSLTEEEKERILRMNKDMTSHSYRTLAVAFRLADSFKKDQLEEGLIFLGLAIMEDPPREEVKRAIELCRTAGIKIKMITGDDKETAIAIGKQIDLIGEILTGKDLDKITDEELSKIVDNIIIFARVRPEHKLRIVKALKQNGEIVTMTGDGVNDAPALKEAHIGVAMGKNGTDVSRDASDLILKDDNFATIVAAIREGRTIFSNVRKFVTYQLSDNFAELSIIFIAILVGLPLPLLALQILFMNLVTDDMPAITLGLNSPSHDVMEMPPRKESNILNKYLIAMLVIAGSVMMMITLSVFTATLFIKQDVAAARTAALITLVFLEVANAFNFRSFRYPVHKLPLFTNKYLVYASFLSILATILVIRTPLNIVFGTTPVGFPFWVIAACLSLLIIVVFDLIKIYNKKYNFFPEHV